jgi:hypothetical protein
MMTALKLINCGAIREPGVISRCFDICMGRCMQRPIQGKLHILYSALFEWFRGECDSKVQLPYFC